jgi:mannosyl-glycoprotein endo-beta-N-acetylglucosaminidase
MPAGSTPGWYPDYGVSATGYVRVIFNGTIGYAFADYIILYPVSGSTTAALNLRSGAGTNFSVVTVMPAGATVTVILGPVSNGWYQVEYGLQSGYALGTYLAFQDNNVSFVPGETPRTTTALRLRTGAGTGYATIAVLPTNTQVTIISGPIFANTYGWYRVSSAYGTGWVAGDYLQ